MPVKELSEFRKLQRFSSKAVQKNLSFLCSGLKWQNTNFERLVFEQAKYPVIQWLSCTELLSPVGGGESVYERSGDARPKFWIKPLKETDLGVVKGFFDP